MNADSQLCRNYNECGGENDAAAHNCPDFATCTDVDGNDGITCECDDGLPMLMTSCAISIRH